MIHTFSTDNLNFPFLDGFLKNKNVILVHPDDVEKTTAIIKQWIAVTMDKHYDRDPQKMIEAKEHFFRFMGVSLLDKEFILITK